MRDNSCLIAHSSINKIYSKPYAQNIKIHIHDVLN